MKDNLENRIKELANQFDIAEPSIGHFDRFEAKLSQKEDRKVIQWNPNTWKWLTVAASVLLLVGFWFGNYSAKAGMELADISPEMEETQTFFMASIQKEVEKINLQRNENNAEIIDDAFAQLKTLESKYDELTIELEDTSEDKRIIYAMIANFQQRIEVLEHLLEQLEEIKIINSELNAA